jgi:hypothetical protein
VQLARSFFLALKAQSLLQYPALSLLQYAQSIYNHYQHLAQLTTLRSHRSHSTTLLPPPFSLTSPIHLFIHTTVGLSMGKPMGRHPFPITLSPKTQKGPKKGSSFHDFRFALRSIFDKLSKSQKWSNMTKCSSKLGQGQQGFRKGRSWV